MSGALAASRFGAGSSLVDTLRPAAPDVARMLIVRHGVTQWNAEARYQGRCDVPLSDEGRRQAEEMGAALGDLAIDAAYTSPLARARTTADAILAGRGVRALAVPELAELCYGAYQGKRREQLLADASALVARWESAPWSVRFPNGESLDDLRRRVVPVWNRLTAAHRGDVVLVSAHGHLNRVLLLHALRLPRDRFWDVPQPNGGCVVVDVGPAGTSATFLEMSRERCAR